MIKTECLVIDTEKEKIMVFGKLTFKGGVHPDDNKRHTAAKPIEIAANIQIFIGMMKNK